MLTRVPLQALPYSGGWSPSRAGCLWRLLGLAFISERQEKEEGQERKGGGAKKRGGERERER